MLDLERDIHKILVLTLNKQLYSNKKGRAGKQGHIPI